LRAARHPLLQNPVPVTIAVVPPSTVLLITGPNTGGKTVAIKTAGLLALMAQAGLWIPAAEGSCLPVFRSLFADIGDAQSIEASLSTFSAHIANLIAIDRSLVTPALVLFDEVGSGTDPAEGGALGVAVVDHFRKRGATLVATSHYDALKTYATTADGVTSAAFGFDPDTFAPTYQLRYGAPGRSLALEMATRLGLSPSVVARARQHLSEGETRIAEHLANLDRTTRALEQECASTVRTREALEAAGVRMRQREDALRQREDAFRRRSSEALDAEVRKARREIDGVIADLKTRTSALAQEAERRPITTGEMGAARSRARAALDRVVGDAVEHVPEPSSDVPPPALAPAPDARGASVGDRVVLGAFGLEGVVTALYGDVAEVDVRGKRMRVGVRDMRVVGAPATARVRVNVTLQPRDAAVSDLNIVGCRVDEALDRAQRFLDESLLTDQHTVRVIHGYGTGQLKRALSGFLQQHPLVARIETAAPDQGGGGVTVVELKA
jgi:DNA mismatch repair protein MutS2